MGTGRLFYKMMLWALAAAAVCGILAMLTASYETLGRVSATALVTAVAAGVAWGVAEMLESPAARHARIMAFATVVVSYLFALLGIWVSSLSWRSSALDCFATSTATAICGGLAVVCLAFLNMDKARSASVVGIVVSGATWALLMLAIWGEIEECLVSSFAVGLPGLLAAVCLVAIRLVVRDAWKWIGVVSSAAVSVLLLSDIWDFAAVSEKLVLVLICLSSVMVHASVVTLIPLNANQIWLRIATIAAAALTGVCVATVVVSDLQRGDSLVGRLAGASAIAAGCGTLAIAIVRKFNRGQSTAAAASVAGICFFCPRCGMKQKAAFGDIQCPRCEFSLHIRARTNSGEPEASEGSPAE